MEGAGGVRGYGWDGIRMERRRGQRVLTFRSGMDDLISALGMEG